MEWQVRIICQKKIVDFPLQGDHNHEKYSAKIRNGHSVCPITLTSSVSSGDATVYICQIERKLSQNSNLKKKERLFFFSKRDISAGAWCDISDEPIGDGHAVPSLVNRRQLYQGFGEGSSFESHLDFSAAEYRSAAPEGNITAFIGCCTPHYYT